MPCHSLVHCAVPYVRLTSTCMHHQPSTPSLCSDPPSRHKARSPDACFPFPGHYWAIKAWSGIWRSEAKEAILRWLDNLPSNLPYNGAMLAQPHRVSPAFANCWHRPIHRQPRKIEPIRHPLCWMWIRLWKQSHGYYVLQPRKGILVVCIQQDLLSDDDFLTRRNHLLRVSLLQWRQICETMMTPFCHLVTLKPLLTDFRNAFLCDARHCTGGVIWRHQQRGWSAMGDQKTRLECGYR